MSTSQKAMIVKTGPDGHAGLDELNIELDRGWTVAEVAPMSGAGGATDAPVVAALVILEHDDRPETEPKIATEAVDIEQEETEEVVDEVVDEIDDVVEGDGI
jgi:hypothetical protein